MLLSCTSVLEVLILRIEMQMSVLEVLILRINMACRHEKNGLMGKCTWRQRPSFSVRGVTNYFTSVVGLTTVEQVH